MWSRSHAGDVALFKSGLSVVVCVWVMWDKVSSLLCAVKKAVEEEVVLAGTQLWFRPLPA